MNKPFLFIHIPKTAGTSIKRLGFRDQGHHKRAVEVDGLDKYFSFCFIRNPYEKVLSSYFFTKSRGNFTQYDTFKDMVLDYQYARERDDDFARHYHHTMTEFIMDEDGNVLVDYVGHFDNLHEDFKKMQIQNGVSNPKELGIHLNKTNHKHWSEYYDEETASIIYEHWKDDFENFNFNKDSWRKMISLVIPTYRNPKCLDICLRSAIENQVNKNEIVVVVDGYREESEEVLQRWKDDIKILDLGQNQGMQQALNLGVYNSTNSTICIINDDNVLCKDWDVEIDKVFYPKRVMTINQIEPKGPSIFNFKIHDFGKNVDEFDYERFIKEEPNYREDNLSADGGIFPFVISKKNYMKVGGFDTLYDSPFVCDWDFFLKLQLCDTVFYRTHNLNFYHFGSVATKKNDEKERFSKSEQVARSTYEYKWGMKPNLYQNNLHGPKGQSIKGVDY